MLVLSPDRLSRKYAYQVLLTEEWLRHGVETIFIKAPQSQTPEDQLLLQFQGMIAEYERAQILERNAALSRAGAAASPTPVATEPASFASTFDQAIKSVNEGQQRATAPEVGAWLAKVERAPVEEQPARAPQDIATRLQTIADQVGGVVAAGDETFGPRAGRFLFQQEDRPCGGQQHRDQGGDERKPPGRPRMQSGHAVPGHGDGSAQPGKGG